MQEILMYGTGSDGVLVMLEKGVVKHIPKEDIAKVFEKYGGGFTQSLGIALYKADSINTQKILDAWDEMVKEYIGKFIL